MFALYFNFGIDIMETKKKIQTSFKSLVSKESKNMVVEKNLRVTIKLYKKQFLPFITRNKKHLSKQE